MNEFKFRPVEEKQEQVTPSLETKPTLNFKPVETTEFPREALYTPVNIGKIRKYMRERNGVDIDEYTDDEVVENFFTIQRYIDSGNLGTISRESIHLHGLDQDGKKNVADVYDMWDRVSGGWEGTENTVDALTDYAGAAIFDVTNLAGFVIGRAATSGGRVVASLGLRKAARAARDAAIKGAIAKGASTQTASAAGKAAATAIFNQAGAAAGTKVTASAALKPASRVMVGGAIGAGAEGLVSSVATEGVRNMGNPEDEFSTGNVLFSTLASGAAGAAGFYLANRFLGRPNDPNLAKNISIKKPRKLNPDAYKNIVSNLQKTFDTILTDSDWLAAAAQGKKILGPDKLLNFDVFKRIVLGDPKNGVKGIDQLMFDAGVDYKSDDTFSHLVLNFFKDMPDDVKKQFDPLFKKSTGGVFKSLDEFAEAFAATSRQVGQYQNVLSVASKRYQDNVLKNFAESKVVQTQLGKKRPLDEIAWAGPYEAYFRNVFKRAIVSNLKTTAVNVMGSVSYLTMATARDMLLMGGNIALGKGQKAKAHLDIMRDRFTTLFSPEANAEFFKEVLKINPKIFESLSETTSGGFRDPKSKDEIFEEFGFTKSRANKAIVGATEGYIDFAQRLSFVSAQDMFFKHVGLYDNLNRIAKLKYNRSLNEIIASGDFKSTFNVDDFGKAVHETLQMTFSADYTKRNVAYNKTNAFTSEIATTLETLSNTPVVGFFFPFGRFANNTIATAYQFSPVASVVEMMKGAVNTVRGLDNAYDTDAIAKGFVGAGATAMLYLHAKQAKEDGENFLTVKTPTGDRLDISNVYPANLFAIYGELGRRMIEGEDIDKDFALEMGRVAGLGQIIEDLNLDDSQTLIVDLVQNVFKTLQDDFSNMKDFGGAAGQFFGSVLSGYTRPLEIFSDAITSAAVVDGAESFYQPDRKVRVADSPGGRFMEAFNDEATRYVGGIFKLLSDGTDPLKIKHEGLREGPAQRYDVLFETFSGLKTLPGRNFTEKMYNMAQIPAWQANIRSKHPIYNRLVNEEIAPLIDYKAEALLRTKDWNNADYSKRRALVKALFRSVESEVQGALEAKHGVFATKVKLQKKLMGYRDNAQTYDMYTSVYRQGGFTDTINDMSFEDLIELDRMITNFRGKYSRSNN